MTAMFQDREAAAFHLAAELDHYKGRRDAVVLCVPRGGLPIGAVLARELGLALDVVLIKKIGHPGNPEFAIGAVSLTGETIDAEAVRRAMIAPGDLAAEISRIRQGLLRKYRMYHGAAQPASLAGKTVILTDDGAATGETLMAAIELLRREGAGRIVVAIPVAPPETAAALRRLADEVVCLETPADFMAIGQYYADFSQVSDEEAVAILRPSSRAGHA
jgi:predicted phosphoribosyltransferase